LRAVVRPGEPTIGVLAVPVEHAQGVCDRLVAITQHGSTRSLNAGVATGIALYEISRHRR